MLRITERTRYLVSEFGASAPGEIARLAGLVHPDIGVVLMVGMAHAGGFGGVEATQKTKTELVEAIREALQALIDDGSYQKVLDRNNIGAYAVESAEVNQGKAA